MKIHIIGCSGSGKTYLAKKLEQQYQIPHYDLDDIQWDQRAKGYGVKMPMKERTVLFEKILSNEDWIIEGVYYQWVQSSFEKSDVIYVLDMPGYLCKYRIVRRFIKRKIGLEKGKQETVKSLFALLKWTDVFLNRNLPEIREILKQYHDKVIWITRQKELKKIMGG